MTKPKTLVIYHAECADGFTSAWVVGLALAETHDLEFLAQKHDTPLEVDTAVFDNVYIVDFSFSADVLTSMAESSQVIVIDHHVSAQRALSHLVDKADNSLQVTFDMAKCGAMLTWEHFFPNVEAPNLVKYVQDRDLWAWELPKSKEVNTCIQMTEYDFSEWSALAKQLDDDIDVIALFGAAALKFKDQQVDILAKKAYTTVVDGHTVPCVNSPLYQSEIGNVLCVGQPFAAVWYMLPDGGVSVSLRSDKDCADAVDVSAIAAAHGGGGHKNAAGFRVTQPYLEV